MDPGFTRSIVTSRKSFRLRLVSVLFWKFHENPFHRFSAMLLKGMDSSEIVEKNSCVQGVKWNILKMFPIVPFIKSHLPWKCHENPFCRFSVTARQPDKQTDKPTDNDENITFALAEVIRHTPNRLFSMRNCAAETSHLSDEIINGKATPYIYFCLYF